MTKLGSNYPKPTSDPDAVRFNSICHHRKDGKFNLGYMDSTKMFTCFSSCSESFDIYEVVKKNRALHGIKMGFYQQVEYVAEVTGNFIGRKRQVGFGQPNYIIDDWDFIEGYDIRETQQTIYEPIKRGFINAFDRIYTQDWLDDGINIDAMKDFNIRYNIIDHQVIIPHFHAVTGELIGIRARNLLPEPLADGKKYMPVYLEGNAFNHPLGGNLYGMYENKKAIQKLRKIMIIESEKGVMQSSTMYGGNNFTVAICSSNITNMQRDLILDADVDEVILGFDKDFELDSPEYERKMKTICRLAQKFVPYMRVYILEDHRNILEINDSPTDKGREVLEQLMSDKIELTMDMINDILKGE